MNIWIFNHYARTPMQQGSTRHHEIASYLIKKGINVTIFASSYSHAKRIELVEYNNKDHVAEVIDGVKYCWIKTPPYSNSVGRIRNMMAYTKKVIKIINRNFHEEPVDLVIGSSVHPGAVYAGYRIAKIKNSKFFFEERDLWPQTFIDFGKIKEKHPISTLLYKMEGFFYKKSDKIIVLFDKAVDYVESKGVSRKKVIHIPNGVNLNYFKDIRCSKAVDDIIQPLRGKYIVAYTGAIGQANHLQALLNLAERTMDSKDLKNVHYLIVGQGPLKTELIKTVKDKKINNVTFADPIQKIDIPYLLTKVDMTYISIMDSPLYKWGFSMNKLFDYMASGKPMLMHTNPSLAGEYTKVPNVFVSNDINFQIDIIKETLGIDSKIAKENSMKMKEYVESNSWDRLALKLYNEIINVVDQK